MPFEEYNYCYQNSSKINFQPPRPGSCPHEPAQQYHGWPMRGNIKFVLFTQVVRGDTNHGYSLSNNVFRFLSKFEKNKQVKEMHPA